MHGGCRGDIESADQAVAAVAVLLQHLAPDQDVQAVMRKLAQVGSLGCVCLLARCLLHASASAPLKF